MSGILFFIFASCELLNTRINEVESMNNRSEVGWRFVNSNCCCGIASRIVVMILCVILVVNINTSYFASHFRGPGRSAADWLLKISLVVLAFIHSSKTRKYYYWFYYCYFSTKKKEKKNLLWPL